MKQIFEKKSETLSISEYFKKIEALANNMGIDVDDLIKEPIHPKVMHSLFRMKTISNTIERRRDTFIQYQLKENGRERNPDMKLTML